MATCPRPNPLEGFGDHCKRIAEIREEEREAMDRRFAARTRALNAGPPDPGKNSAPVDTAIRESDTVEPKPATFPVEHDGGIPPGVANALDRAIAAEQTSRETFQALCIEHAELIQGDAVAVPKAERDLLRKCATTAVAVAQRYGQREPWKADIAAVVEAGHQIADRGIDLGTLTTEEKQLELDRADLAEQAIIIGDEYDPSELTPDTAAFWDALAAVARHGQRLHGEPHQLEDD